MRRKAKGGEGVWAERDEKGWGGDWRDEKDVKWSEVTQIK